MKKIIPKIQIDQQEELTMALTALSSNQIILCPTDTVWSLAGRIRPTKNVERLQKLSAGRPDYPLELLVSSLEMFRGVSKEVHPRIEMLLSYHQRPLSVLLNLNDNIQSLLGLANQEIPVRLIKNGFIHDLIETFGEPLLSIPASKLDAKIPQYFGQLRSDILEEADYIVRVKQRDRNPKVPSVLVRLPENAEEFDFLRD